MGFLKNIFNGSSYFMLNKVILKEVGLDEAVILSCLIEAGELFEKEWFYQTVETVEELTTITEYRQNRALKNLEKMGILERKLMGLPAKRHFRINVEKIIDILSNKLPKNLGNCNHKNLGNLDPNFYGTYTQNFMDNKEIKYKEIKDKKNSINKDVFSSVEILEVGEELKSKLLEYIEYRKEMKKPLNSMRSIKEVINKIGKEYADEKDLCNSISHSIERGWIGIFKDKDTKHKTHAQIEEKEIAVLSEENFEIMYNQYKNYGIEIFTGPKKKQFIKTCEVKGIQI
ncbi:hypothetical protein [Cetobacterium sp.]|uniref:hypothetical protein n=1 Tax=Cetobacterium sp. TaxID=2071632 RepID=UPI003EE7EE95